MTASTTDRDRVGDWLRSGPHTRTSLARYRVLFATAFLLLLPDFSWVADYPDAFYNAPPGPFRLLDGFPPEVVLRLLEAGLAAALIAVLLGWHTRTASFAAAGLCLTGFGFEYSMGKIDHTVLVVMVLPFLALAGWGDRLSLDAARRRARGLPEPPELAQQWPLRLFSLVIGLAFATAALPKLRGGWLDPSTHAVQGTHARQVFTHDQDDLLSRTFLDIDNDLLWEALDVMTLVFEAGLVVLVLTWGLTRLGYAVATLFHLGVYLMINIAFVANVLTYGFVVAWDRVPTPESLRGRQAPRALQVAAPAVVLAGGALWAALLQETGNAASVVDPVVLVVGGAIGSAYLAVRLARLRPARV